MLRGQGGVTDHPIAGGPDVASDTTRLWVVTARQGRRYGHAPEMRGTWGRDAA